MMNLDNAGPRQSSSGNRTLPKTMAQVASSAADAPSTSNEDLGHEFLIPSDGNEVFDQWLKDAFLNPYWLDDDGAEAEAAIAAKVMVAWQTTDDGKVGLFAHYVDKDGRTTEEGTAILKKHGYLNDSSNMTRKALKVVGLNLPVSNSPADPAVSGSYGDTRAKA